MQAHTEVFTIKFNGFSGDTVSSLNTSEEFPTLDQAFDACSREFRKLFGGELRLVKVEKETSPHWLVRGQGRWGGAPYTITRHRQ